MKTSVSLSLFLPFVTNPLQTILLSRILTDIAFIDVRYNRLEKEKSPNFC